MLKSIYISNYALISSLDISFEKGFSVLTGETGAGKSIILGALSLILGQRADSKAIKASADKCVVEANFDISDYKHLHDFFEKNDLDHDGKLCIIRRELTSAGKSRAFVNDTPVSLTVLRELSNRLIDIHSQHENLLLSNAGYQLEVIDTVARNRDLFDGCKTAFHVWKSYRKELQNVLQTAAEAAEELDFIRFQYQQLEAAQLLPNEQEALEAELETLNHAEEIKIEIARLVNDLDGEDNALVLLKDALGAIQKIAAYIPEGVSQMERLQSAYIDLKELNVELQHYQERLEFNPGRLEQVENRLSELYSLQQKFKVSTVAELMARQEEFAARLLHIEAYDDVIRELESKVAQSESDLQKASRALSKSRLQQIPMVEAHLIDQLRTLGMPHIQFAIKHAEIAFSELGIDQVEFMFSANKNRPMQPVAQIASGGEVSRLMLSIKSMIAGKSDLPTIIFDEIDTGVSGEIADRMGEIMHQLGNAMQVITITHLPQIAARGRSHFKVYKDESGAQTETYIVPLSRDERINELATMLSGKVKGEAAIQNARELLADQ